MAFDLTGFLKFTRCAWFGTKGTNRRLTPKRVGRLLLVYSLYPLLELVTWLGLLIDDVLFAGYRRQEVEQPVFILGNPRSGTTFLHRLMARDERTFSYMATWEILFAPSITARKLCRAAMAVDLRLGGLLGKVLSAAEKGVQEGNVMHKIDLQGAEEDENVMLHTWSVIALWTWTAMLEGARSFTFYEEMTPPPKRKRTMTFYRRCVLLYPHLL